MTTVGYGDITPGTWMGRLTIIGACLAGSFIMAIFIGSITQQFVLSSDQTLALHHVLLTRSAANSVTKGIKFFIAKKRYYLQLQKIDSTLIENSRFLALVGNKTQRKKILAKSKSSVSDDMAEIFKSHELASEQLAGIKMYQNYMISAKIDLLNGLKEFKEESASLRQIRQEKINENATNGRMVKTEVSEMAKRMDRLEKIILN